MRAFHWDGCFVTGLHKVDEQHHHLVNLINGLGDAVLLGEPGVTGLCEQLFVELTAYAQYHFSEEERLMAQVRLDPRHFQRHRQSHRYFTEQLSSMWASRNAVASPLAVLHEFLVAWLSFHILGEDQAMARQLARIQAGVSAAEAFDLEEAPREGATAALLGALSSLYRVLSQQNRDLADTNRLLEQRVAERTEALELSNRLLERASRTDGLLGIANRMSFDEALDREWRRAAREGTPLALLMMDVDHFKRYNDKYGHPGGDECLRAVARTVEAALRRPGDQLARYGGEELVGMLPNTDLERAHMVALAIQEAIVQLGLPHPDSPVSDRVTLSIGVAAVIPEHGSAPSVLVAAADRALYAAKAAGRNRVVA